MKKIFIADDNEDLLELMHSLFRREYTVYCCAHSNNMSKEITDFAPDLLLIDNCMGNTDSATIIADLKRNDHTFSIPFLLLSAHPFINEIAAKLGADGYVEKPFDVNYIRSYVKEIFQNM